MSKLTISKLLHLLIDLDNRLFEKWLKERQQIAVNISYVESTSHCSHKSDCSVTNPHVLLRKMRTSPECLISLILERAHFEWVLWIQNESNGDVQSNHNKISHAANENQEKNTWPISVKREKARETKSQLVFLISTHLIQCKERVARHFWTNYRAKSMQT